MKTPRVLLVDIGNTSTTVALSVGERLIRITQAPGGLNRKRDVTALLRRVAGGKSPVGGALSSVVPAVNAVWREALDDACECPSIVVNHRIRLGVRVEYPKPETIGADRLANASAVVERLGSPALVADFGTALTFDVLGRGDAYLGGVIAPGLPLMTDYLAERTALLPHIKLGGRYGRVGKSTEGAMRIGARIGYRGIVHEIVDYLMESLDMGDARLCATGGYAKWVLDGLEMPFVHEPNLTLKGLRRIYSLNARDFGERKGDDEC